MRRIFGALSPGSLLNTNSTRICAACLVLAFIGDVTNLSEISRTGPM